MEHHCNWYCYISEVLFWLSILVLCFYDELEKDWEHHHVT